VLRFGLPVAGSLAAFALLLSRIDFAAVLGHVDARTAGLLVPAVLLYCAVSLWIEARSISGLARPASSGLGISTCARMKAASYPLGLLNYALGAGGLTYLLRRRGGLRIAEAAGIVILIALFDLGILLLLSAVGALLLSTQPVALQAGVIVTGVVGIVGGFAVLRTPLSLGALDRVRDLEIFRAARTAPTRQLLVLGLHRLGFVISFVLVCGAALVIFDVHVPPGDLIVGVAVVSLVASLPIAVAGLGTGQVAFVFMFRHWGTPEVLLASNLALTAALIVVRAGMGLIFAQEFTREALVAAREANP
jgi:hypothetical protein